MMDPTTAWNAFLAWPPAERLAFASRVMQQMDADFGPPEPDPELIALLASREAAFEADPTSGLSWDEVLAEFKQHRS